MSSPVPAPPDAATGRCRFGLYEFDFRTGELRREGQIIKLSPQPSRVLALLLARPGEIVLRDDFRKDLWGEDTCVDFERGLNFCILQVRGALGDSSDNPRFVQTVPRKGYRFIAPVAFTSVPPTVAAPAQSWQNPTSNNSYGGQSPATAVASLSTLGTADAPAQTGQNSGSNASYGGQSPATVVASHPAQGAAEASTQTRQNSSSNCSYGGQSPATAVASGTAIAAVAAVVAVLALVAAGTWFASRNSAVDNRALSSSRPVRIAVLPFANLTGDASADYLADGLTDDVIAQLGQLSPRGLAVIARTSAMTYRNTAKTVSAIGRELDVSFVVESSLRREGDGVRIASRLVPVSDQTPVAQWSEIFGSTDATSNDSQTGASIRLARLIALELAPAASAADIPRPTSDLVAWDGFLQGRAQLNRSTPDDVGGAIAKFEAAVQRDPNFAGAWAKLAEARHVLVMMGALAPERAYPAARQAAARALAADSQLADAHLAQGLVQLWYDWKPADAAKSFEKALALNESHAAAHHDYAWSLMALGRTPEAIAHITTARDLDPLSVRANNDIGWLHLHLRQPADAARACEQTLAINANSLEAQACLERAHAQRGLYGAALRAARAALPPGDRERVSTEDRRAADALRAVWQWRLERLEQASRTRWISPYTLAVHHVLLGNVERALDQLEAAFQHRAGMMVFLHHDPALDPLRSHPRFVTLVNRMTESAR